MTEPEFQDPTAEPMPTTETETVTDREAGDTNPDAEADTEATPERS